MKKEIFIDRKHEMELLSDLWDSDSAELLIIYGRRRVGKTTLLVRWVEESDCRALYWVSDPGSSFEQLRSFSQAIFNFANPDNPAPGEFSYGDWRQALQQAAALAKEERLVLIIDEITYLLSADPGVAGVLQNTWDHILKNTNLLLILSGSHIGMMEKHFSYQAPLYGRATATLLLRPLPFSATHLFFPGYSPEDRVNVYAMLGGIPAYWERFKTRLSISENIRRQFLSTSNLLHDEPLLLLQDFLTTPNNYVAILRALTHNARTPGEIARYSGMDEKHVPKYLQVLRDTRYVERRIPVTAAQSSRLGRHYIVDPFLRFYYRFLSLRQAQLVKGQQQQALEEIRRHLVDFIGTHTWEELCREWLLYAGANNRIPFLSDQVGSAWTNRAQVDVVGINSMEKTLVLGECKWGKGAVGSSVLRKLVSKTDEIIPNKGRWTVYFVGFSRGGWTNGAHNYAESRSNDHGKNWRAAGMSLVDLNELDQDLFEWELK